MQALAKFAGIIYVINDIMKNPALARAGLANLKSAFKLFSSNKNQFPLVYESECYLEMQVREILLTMI